MVNIDEIKELQEKIDTLSKENIVNEQNMKDCFDRAYESIFDALVSEFDGLILNGYKLNMELYNRSIVLHIEGKSKKYKFCIINYGYDDVGGGFRVTNNIQYDTKNGITYNLNKMVFLLITAFETKDMLYNVICDSIDSYHKAFGIYHSVLYLINDDKTTLEKKLYKELRRQLIENFEVGDVYELHKGKVEVVSLEEGFITYILLDSIGNKFEDLKVNIAHQILEKAPKREKKIAETFIDASGFKK